MNPPTERPHAFDLEARFRDPQHAAAAILPVPYDATSTWKKGADRGPEALLNASTQVELYDIETASEPYLHGIATLPELRFSGDPTALADAVCESVGAIFDRDQIAVVLGGEHSVSIGAMRAAASRYPSLSVLQLDAHADTRDSYEGSDHNHACVMARARELCPIAQVGIRSLDRSELERLDRRRVVFAHEIAAPDCDWQQRTLDLLTPNVYVTIDLDVLDPAIMPSTGTPEPGGLSWYQVTGLLAQLVQRHRVVGFDVVELLPQPGQHASEFLAAKLVHHFLALILAARSAP